MYILVYERDSDERVSVVQFAFFPTYESAIVVIVSNYDIDTFLCDVIGDIAIIDD